MKLTSLLSIFFFCPCCSNRAQDILASGGSTGRVVTGAERTDIYLPWLRERKVAVVANPASTIGRVHLVDSLLRAGIHVVRVFGPEHGFRGDADAGEKIPCSRDAKTGLPVFSLYGKHVKPTRASLSDVDVVLFDIQDVGARFFTYISTLTYVMEACAGNGIELIVLDRPDPNGDYVDGPVLEKEYASFVGLHPVPVVHGMTMAEYALMVNGEGWLEKGVRCKLRTVLMEHYTHATSYDLPVKPSPNLPDMTAVRAYPSVCLFEGTIISVGRGTERPFSLIGHPDYGPGTCTFTPREKPGMATNPPYEGILCRGYDLASQDNGKLTTSRRLDLSWLIIMYSYFKERPDFFNTYFDTLAGTPTLREQIIRGLSEEEIRESWQPGLDHYKKIRKKYLLYKDFE
jgi:uncharacterized protein YbbC (DUF1343 family)